MVTAEPGVFLGIANESTARQEMGTPPEQGESKVTIFFYPSLLVIQLMVQDIIQKIKCYGVRISFHGTVLQQGNGSFLRQQ